MKTLLSFISNNKPVIEEEIEGFFKELHLDDPFIKEFLKEIEGFCLRKGKRIRPLLALLSYKMFGGRRKSFFRTAASLELLHAYLLIHDDVMDNSSKRRGADTLHKLYEKKSGNREFGRNMAILAGDILDCLVYSRIPDKAAKFIRQVEYNTCLGQAMDLRIQQYGADELSIMEMYRYKTAKYSIEGPLLLGAMEAQKDRQVLESLSAYAVPLGQAFQLQDDCLDIFSSQTGKERYSDLKEGKYTLLIYKTLELCSSKDKDYMRKHLGNEIAQREAMKIARIIQKSGAKDYVDKKIESLIAQAREALLDSPLTKKQQRNLYVFSELIMGREN